MPTIHQPDVSDPIEQRLRRLGEHLDAEREARSRHFNDIEVGLGPNAEDHSMQLTVHRGPAEGNELGVGEQGALRYRWLGAAAVLLAIVASAAILVGNRGGGTVQTAPVTVSATGVTTSSPQPTRSTGSMPTTAPATETVAASTVPTEAERPVEANAGAGMTDPSDTAWVAWPTLVDSTGELPSPGDLGETISIASGPDAVILASRTSMDGVAVVDIWTTTDGVGGDFVGSDPDADAPTALSDATVAGTADAYYVAAESNGQTVLWRSADGQEWSRLDDSFSGVLVGTGGAGPALFRELPDGTIETSTDGLAWKPIETYGTSESESASYGIENVRFVGGTVGYVGVGSVGDLLAFVESIDGHRWTQLPTAPVIGVPTLVEGGILVVGADWETCDDPCSQTAYRFDSQTREWSPVATPPLGGFTELARVGDAVVASGTVERDGIPVVEVFVSPADRIEWTKVEIRGEQIEVDPEPTALKPTFGIGNRVIVPVPNPYGQFVVGAVADGGVANYGLASLPACAAPSGPLAQDCSYELVKGDTPMSIADRFGVGLEALRAANADVADRPLVAMAVGTRIIIPASNG